MQSANIELLRRTRCNQENEHGIGKIRNACFLPAILVWKKCVALARVRIKKVKIQKTTSQTLYTNHFSYGSCNTMIKIGQTVPDTVILKRSCFYFYNHEAALLRNTLRRCVQESEAVRHHIHSFQRRSTKTRKRREKQGKEAAAIPSYGKKPCVWACRERVNSRGRLYLERPKAHSGSS